MRFVASGHYASCIFKEEFDGKSAEDVPSITQSASPPHFSTSASASLSLTSDSCSVKLIVRTKLGCGLLSNRIPDSYTGP